jgi:hypothetical protein
MKDEGNKEKEKRKENRKEKDGPQVKHQRQPFINPLLG